MSFEIIGSVYWYREWCKGGKEAGEKRGSSYCHQHHEGAYCSSCESGYVMSDNICVDCSTLSGTNKSLSVFLVGLALVVAVWVSRRFPKVKLAMNLAHSKTMITKAKHM